MFVGKNDIRNPDLILPFKKNQKKIKENKKKWNNIIKEKNYSKKELENIFSDFKEKENFENEKKTNLFFFEYSEKEKNNKIALSCVKELLEKGVLLEEVFITTLDEAMTYMLDKKSKKAEEWRLQFMNEDNKVFVILDAYTLSRNQLEYSAKEFFTILKNKLVEDRYIHCYISLRNSKEKIDYMFVDGSRRFFKNNFIHYK